MKNTMKKLTAALLAMACVPVISLTTKAAIFGGDDTWESFADFEPFDDHGMFQKWENEQLYTGENCLIFVKVNENAIRVVLRSDVAMDTAPMQLAEMLNSYFPGIKDGLDEKEYEAFHTWRFQCKGIILTQEWSLDAESKVFELKFSEIPENAAELETSILLDLARHRMLSEFYGWGGTAQYRKRYFYNSYKYDERDTDWNAVQAYLDEHHPGCTVMKNLDGQWHLYTAPGTNLSYRQDLEFARELWDAFQIVPSVFEDKSEQTEIATGHNALEQPGDTNLDCEVNILDVISVNKFILGAKILDKTEEKNADLNGNGAPDSEDSLAILKDVLES